jgi:hypothetical protein
MSRTSDTIFVKMVTKKKSTKSSASTETSSAVEAPTPVVVDTVPSVVDTVPSVVDTVPSVVDTVPSVPKKPAAKKKAAPKKVPTPVTEEPAKVEVITEEPAKVEVVTEDPTKVVAEEPVKPISAKKAPAKKKSSSASAKVGTQTHPQMKEIHVMEAESEDSSLKEVLDKSETLILHLPIKSSDVHNHTHPKGIHQSIHTLAPLPMEMGTERMIPIQESTLSDSVPAKAHTRKSPNLSKGNTPIAIYSLEGDRDRDPDLSSSSSEDATEGNKKSSYEEILKESSNMIERRESVIFAENTIIDRDASKINEEFDKRVKEFKLTHYITTIPKDVSVDDEGDDGNHLKGMESEGGGRGIDDGDDANDVDHFTLLGDHSGTFLKELSSGASSVKSKGGGGGGGGGGGIKMPGQGSLFADFSGQEESSHIYAHDSKGGSRMVKKNLKNIMVEFMNANLYQEWPDQTNIHCWWCCHQFEGPPCCLPEYLRRDKFYVSGCFCTFNCAAAYNFNRNDNNVWERYSLLNLMYKKLFNTTFVKIEMAPPREVLKMFGGYMEIDEFRDHCLKQEKSFQVVRPPLVSIIPKIEEHINPKNRVVNEHILNSTQSKLKLTRSKPLISEKSSIQTYMNITFKKEDPSDGAGSGEGGSSI